MARSSDEATVIAQRAIQLLEGELPIAAAMLFGSYVEGTPHDGSDIDLAVFTPDESRLKVKEKSRLQLRLQHACSMDLELHLYPERALAGARPTNFYGYIMQHGRRLR